MNKLEALKVALKDYKEMVQHNQETDAEDRAIILLLEMKIEELENVSRETLKVNPNNFLIFPKNHGRVLANQSLLDFVDLLKSNAEKTIKHIEADFMAKHSYHSATEVYLKTQIDISNQDQVFIDDMEYVSRETLHIDYVKKSELEKANKTIVKLTEQLRKIKKVVE